MKIEKINKNHIQIEDELGTSFSLFTLKEGGIQIMSTQVKNIELECRLPRSVIIREKGEL